MRRFVLALLAVGVLAAPGAAEANYPSVQDVAAAKSYARSYWEDQRGFKSLSTWCWPGVSIRFMPMYGGDLAQARMNGCRVILNSRAHWGSSWQRICATMIHEYGHLYGYGHTYKYGSIMYPRIKRFWWCN